MKEVHLGEILAAGEWTSFPGFSSGATDFRFVFGSDEDRERFLSTFLHCTIILPGGKSILLDAYSKWEKPGQWGLHMHSSAKGAIKIQLTDGENYVDDRILPVLKDRILEVISTGHSAYVIHFLLQKVDDWHYDWITQGQVQYVLELMMAEGSVVQPSGPGSYYKDAKNQSEGRKYGW